MTATLDEIAAHAIAVPWAVNSTYRLAMSLIADNIPGDFVECGVYAGAHPAAMAKAIYDAKATGRKVHLFDSFQGIPMTGPKDLDWHRGDPVKRPFGPPGLAEVTPGGDSVCSRQTVEANMAKWGVDPALLVYHEGWFRHTMPNNGIERIALLRLDADLYESTKDCLEHLYSKVGVGGWCICDDFTLDGCREAVLPYLLKPWSCPVYWRVA